MEVRLSLHEDAQSFLDTAGEALYHRETVNNLILGITERLVEYPETYDDPFFATVSNHKGDFLLAAVMTPPRNVVLAGEENFQPAIASLIDYFLANQVPIPGVVGPVQLAHRFANLWEQKTGQETTCTMEQRVYECRNVHFPQVPEGHFRSANRGDHPIIVEWMRAFEEEALHKSGQDYDGRGERLIELGYVFVWEKDERLVSMAMKARPIAHSITIGGVYTPPEHRRRGYATALVARLTDHLLSSGYQFANLFTDLANPTSNSIYQKIGFNPVSDFLMYEFSP